MPEHPTQQEQDDILELVYAIGKTLPCDNCRTHFSKLLNSHPPQYHSQTRDKFTRWLVEVHNRVNERLGKPRIDYDFVKNKYDSMKAATCTSSDECCQKSTTGIQSSSSLNSNPSDATDKTVFYIVGTVIVILIVIIILLNYNKRIRI
jgi:hypothetical protein